GLCVVLVFVVGCVAHLGATRQPRAADGVARALCAGAVVAGQQQTVGRRDAQLAGPPIRQQRVRAEAGSGFLREQARRQRASRRSCICRRGAAGQVGGRRAGRRGEHRAHQLLQRLQRRRKGGQRRARRGGRGAQRSEHGGESGQPAQQVFIGSLCLEQQVQVALQ